MENIEHVKKNQHEPGPNTFAKILQKTVWVRDPIIFQRKGAHLISSNEKGSIDFALQYERVSITTRITRETVNGSTWPKCFS